MGSIGRLGVRTLIVFVGMLAAMAAIVVPLAPALFAWFPARPAGAPLPPGAVEAASQVAASAPGQTLANWLVSLVPVNPIAAAATGAMLPLIVFTLLLALAIVASPAESRAALVGFFRALGDAMLVLVRWVILVAPIGIFALVLPLTAHAGAVLAGEIGYYIVAYMVACVAATMLLYPAVALVGRLPVAAFARAALPPQLIALSSSSSIASLPALVEAADERLRLGPEVSGFVLPLAISTFKVAAPVSWSIGALFIARFYGIPLHARELGLVSLAAVFLAFGIPGIPRGAFITLAPLFAAIGLPIEGIGILIAVDAIPDTVATALNVSGDLAAAAIVSRLAPPTRDAGRDQRRREPAADGPGGAPLV
jgi:Na+/H+-dicarboxylate symporter